MSERVASSREQITKGRCPAVVARVLQVNRSGLYRTPRRRGGPRPGPAVGAVDPTIVEFAGANPTDGTRMVASLAGRELGRRVNRKRLRSGWQTLGGARARTTGRMILRFMR